MNIFEIDRYHSILIYGPPHPSNIYALFKIIKFLAESKYSIFLIDANHYFTPSSLLNIESRYMKKLYLFKPDSLESISRIIDYLTFSTFNIHKKWAVVLNSLFIQVSYTLWPVLKYDPLYIMYEMASLPLKKQGFLSIVFIDTKVEDLNFLPYKNMIKRIFDVVLRRKLVDKEIFFETMYHTIK